METKEENLLSTLDRCDKCSAQAWVIAKGVKSNLYFCAHHFDKYAVKLTEWAYDIVDERHRLTDK